MKKNIQFSGLFEGLLKVKKNDLRIAKQLTNKKNDLWNHPF